MSPDGAAFRSRLFDRPDTVPVGLTRLVLSPDESPGLQRDPGYSESTPSPSSGAGLSVDVLRPPRCPENEPIALVQALNRLGRPRGSVIAVGSDVGAGGLFAPIDQAIASYMTQLSLPNGSLAIVAGDGTLVYAKSFTNGAWYDAYYTGGGVEDNISSPCSLFRWASVTKPVVAAATLSLVRDGILSLNDSVFWPVTRSTRNDWKSLFRDEARGWYFDEWFEGLSDIQLRHLLSHTAGWDEGRSGDVAPCADGTNPKNYDLQTAVLLNQPLPPTMAEFVLTMMMLHTDSIGLQFMGTAQPPGTSFCYSNFGFLLLGAILAEARGTSLERVLDERVFRPVGMGHSSITRSAMEYRRRGEVEYFSTRSRDTLALTSGESDGWNDEGRSHLRSTGGLIDGVYDPLVGRADVREPYGADRNHDLFQGADALRSNVIDMARFSRALRLQSPSPLFGMSVADSASWLNTMWSGLSPMPVRTPGNRGYGLRKSLVNATGGVGSGPGTVLPTVRWVFHRGLQPGCHAALRVYHPAYTWAHLQNASFVYTFNRTNGWVSGGSYIGGRQSFDAVLHPLIAGGASAGLRTVLQGGSGAGDLFAGYP